MYLNDRINQTIINRISKTENILIEKAKQYAQNGRLGNFYDIAQFMGVSPEQACMGLVAKHLVALKDYVNNPEGVPESQWDEKIGDIICYMHLMEAIVVERLRTQEKPIATMMRGKTE